MSKTTAYVAIIVAQLFVMASFYCCRKKGLWKNRASSGIAVFCLEAGFVFLSLVIANLF